MNEKIPILQARNLSRIYEKGEEKVRALDGVDFELYKGEMVAVMGASGSGKSTLLNVLGALDSPTRGGIKINGREAKNYHVEPNATKYRSQNIGFVFQDFNLLKDLTVEDNLALPLILKNMEDEVISQKVEEIIQLVGLDGRQKHRPVELSGGQQQRVAIARALITSPAVLLADEPTGNLDYNTSVEILEMILKIKESMSQSIIMVTHDPKVATYADRVIFLHDGKVVDEYKKSGKKGHMDEILNKTKKILEG